MSRSRTINPTARIQPYRGAAELTGLSPGYIRKLCLEGKVGFIMVGSDRRVDMESLWSYLNDESKKSLASVG